MMTMQRQVTAQLRRTQTITQMLKREHHGHNILDQIQLLQHKPTRHLDSTQDT